MNEERTVSWGSLFFVFNRIIFHKIVLFDCIGI